MVSRKSITNKDKNKDKKSKGNRRKVKVTSKKVPSDNKIVIKIPENAKIYPELRGNHTIIKVPLWRRLDVIYEQAEQNKYEYSIKIYDEFVQRLAVFFPDKVDKINKLRPLILRHILKGLPIDDSYYKEIKEL